MTLRREDLGYFDACPKRFSDADGAAGYRQELSVLQAEFSLTPTLRGQLGAGPLRAGAQGRFRTGVITDPVTPSLHVD
jgi:hypothetical protein